MRRIVVVAVMVAMLGATVTDPIVGTASASGLTMVELRPLPADHWVGSMTMNDDGVAVGYSSSRPSWTSRPVRWDQDGRPTMLASLGGNEGTATDINNAGFVVGWARTGTGAGHAALWRPNGTVVDLGARQPEMNSYAWAINDRGAVVGHINGRATFWHPDGRSVALPNPFGEWSLAERIADDGTIIGRADDPAIGGWVPIRWDGRHHRVTVYPIDTYLLDIAGRGRVVGASVRAGTERHHATGWDPAGRVTAMSSPPGGITSMATAVNRRGAAVGWGGLVEGQGARPVRWDRFGNATVLPGPMDVSATLATDIADDGTAVGYAEGYGSWPVYRALRWDRFGNVSDLGTLPGTVGSTPIEINNQGMVLGVAYDSAHLYKAVLWR